jgi:hypothetical protein
MHHHFDDSEILVMAHAALAALQQPDLAEELHLEYDLGDDFIQSLRNKCRRLIDHHA